MKVVHVAVGVLLDDADRILIAKRADELHQGGLWEFPGGKVESGESVQQALQREFLEEVGVSISTSEPLLEIKHDYGDKQVFLDVHVVREWSGEARGLEGQPLAWVSVSGLPTYEFPAANAPIIDAISNYLG